jgi:hypothetical protein
VFSRLSPFSDFQRSPNNSPHHVAYERICFHLDTHRISTSAARSIRYVSYGARAWFFSPGKGPKIMRSDQTLHSRMHRFGVQQSTSMKGEAMPDWRPGWIVQDVVSVTPALCAVPGVEPRFCMFQLGHGNRIRQDRVQCSFKGSGRILPTR